MRRKMLNFSPIVTLVYLLGFLHTNGQMIRNNDLNEDMVAFKRASIQNETHMAAMPSDDTSTDFSSNSDTDWTISYGNNTATTVAFATSSTSIFTGKISFEVPIRTAANSSDFFSAAAQSTSLKNTFTTDSPTTSTTNSISIVTESSRRSSTLTLSSAMESFETSSLSHPTNLSDTKSTMVHSEETPSASSTATVSSHLNLTLFTTESSSKISSSFSSTRGITTDASPMESSITTITAKFSESTQVDSTTSDRNYMTSASPTIYIAEVSTSSQDTASSTNAQSSFIPYTTLSTANTSTAAAAATSTTSTSIQLSTLIGSTYQSTTVTTARTDADYTVRSSLAFTAADTTSSSYEISTTTAASTEFSSLNATFSQTTSDNTTDTFYTSAETSTPTTTEEPTTVATTTTESPTTTVNPCAEIGISSLEVYGRTPTGFNATLTFNCSVNNASDFQIYRNQTGYVNCSFTTMNSSDKVNFSCQNIENNAGRNWTFWLKPGNSNSAINISQFTVTLEPLPLDSLNFTVVEEELNTVAIYISNCTNIADLSTLSYACHGGNSIGNISLQNNCTMKCDGLQPGSEVNVTLYRANITYADKENQSSSEARITKTAKTKLDTVKNMTFNDALSLNDTSVIRFTKPDGSFSNIYLNCTTNNVSCMNSLAINQNCLSCTSFNIPNISRGANYSCLISTTKENFTTQSSHYAFQTKLTAATFNSLVNTTSTSTKFSVSVSSDYDSLRTTCTPVLQENELCRSTNVTSDNCNTTFKINGNYGCSYICFVTTNKQSFNAVNSENFTWIIVPPKPIVNITSQGSRWIHLKWNIENNTNIHSWDLFVNRIYNQTFNSSIQSYNLTDLLPNRNYELAIELISNLNHSSEIRSTRTNTTAPPPVTAEVKNASIIPLSNETDQSTPTQYGISIKATLFSNDNGDISRYLIYVREDMKNDQEQPKPKKISLKTINESYDYLAYNISVNTMPEEIRFLLGNDSSCESNQSFCNQPLKEDTLYKVLVGGCVSDECTYALSNEFRTLLTPPSGSSSLAWVVVFPLIAILAVAAFFAYRKRGTIKRKFTDRTNKYRKRSEDVQSSIPMDWIYTPPTMKPKLLSKFVDFSKEDDQHLAGEFKDLETRSLQNRRSECEEIYAKCDRYTNITARGHWDGTAVRLNGNDRLHDYINANEIKGVNSDKEFIACQGPLENTCEDFWQMILQYRVTKIVMLTKIEERSSNYPGQLVKKCHPYFPTERSQPMKFNSINIQMIGIEYQQNSELEIRKFRVSDLQNTTEHEVTHFYFTGWPDFNVVEAQQLIDLIQMVQRYKSTSKPPCRKGKTIENAPTVVHCSAGVGRTGTYIAVDIIMNLINGAGPKLSTMRLDVMGIVAYMRADRGKMVQTKEQYILINHCVKEYLKLIGELDKLKNRLSSLYETPTTALPSSTYLTIDSSSSSSTPNNEQIRPYARRLAPLDGRPRGDSTSTTRSTKDSNPSIRKSTLSKGEMTRRETKAKNFEEDPASKLKPITKPSV